jgi:hypothetical protein
MRCAWARVLLGGRFLFCLRDRPAPAPSLPLAAEQERRDVGDAGRSCDREGGGAADGESGKADAGGEQAVQHAFAHPGRDARGDPVACGK